MRRLALSVFTACGLALFTACSAGTGLSTSGNGNNPTFLAFTNGSGQADNFVVTASGVSQFGPPLLQINAIAEKTAGPATIFLPDRQFMWSGRFVNPATDPPSVAQFVTGAVPNGFTACQAKPAATPAVPIAYQPTSGGSAVGFLGGYGLASAAGQITPTVYVGVPVPVPANQTNYCLVIQATDIASGVIGSVTMAVVK